MGYYGYGMSPYGYGMFYDPTYILIIIAAGLSLWASATVRSTYQRYSSVRCMSGITGAQAAEEILRAHGIYDVRIEHIGGNLTDHFDPRDKVVRLSDATYNSTSVAAIGVAAHEIGHVLQHEEGYLPIRIRGSLVPAANIGSRLGLPLVILGFFLGANSTLVPIGIALFTLSVLFHVVTLPVELDASHRALVALDQRGLLQPDEIPISRKVLRAAAMTYVAAAAGSIIQLLRLILISKSSNGRRR